MFFFYFFGRHLKSRLAEVLAILELILEGPSLLKVQHCSDTYFFFSQMYSFLNVCALKGKKSNLLTMQHNRTTQRKSEWPNHKRSTAHAKISMEKKNRHLFVQCIFYILHIIPLRMMNCSQGINQKKVYFILLGIIHWLTQQKPVKQWQRDVCNWSCTDISNYLLSYT